jgi:hypothetical protein
MERLCVVVGRPVVAGERGKGVSTRGKRNNKTSITEAAVWAGRKRRRRHSWPNNKMGLREGRRTKRGRPHPPLLKFLSISGPRAPL